MNECDEPGAQGRGLPLARTSSSAARARPACSSSAASCCANRVPDVPGGGTVAYVNPTEHRYLDDPAHREEGGTPAIVESIRAGLVFQLKQAVGHRRDPGPRGALPAAGGRRLARRTRRSRSSATSTPSGCRSCRSSYARAAAAAYLHHNFVVALLNDLFGIQSRGGCSCAGPYGHRLLGIDLERSHEFEREIAHGCEGIKPGWVRVNFNYFISEAVFDYVVEAVRLVARARLAAAAATTGSTPATGLWRHRGGPVEPPLRLGEVTYDDGRRDALPAARRAAAPRQALAGYLDEARASSPPPAAATAPRRPGAAWCPPTSSTCAGSSCRPPAWPRPRRRGAERGVRSPSPHVSRPPGAGGRSRAVTEDLREADDRRTGWRLRGPR